MSTPPKVVESLPLPPLTQSLSLPTDFHFDELRPVSRVAGFTPTPAAPAASPSLGPLAAFVGSWAGSGFNTIFRPDNAVTPTPLATPVTNTDPKDNLLELNLTAEQLTFSPSLGSVPNRGSGTEGDVFLNGVPYLQTITDTTFQGQRPGIHAEPGLWMAVPSTTVPPEGPTLVRMGSIPHGATIQAQGTSTVINGKPTIPPVDITPFVIGTTNKIPFHSQNATDGATTRIPQDLSTFITAGTITQAMLTNPNSFLQSHIANQTIKSTTVISISTAASPKGTPPFGGGVSNIAFLEGNAPVTLPNAHTLQMTATFWIELVEHQVVVGPFKPGGPAQLLQPKVDLLAVRQPLPVFSVTPPVGITTPRVITVTSVQIQYSQTVMLNFAGLTWPHVSVATLVPSSPITVPASVWA